ncbi:MAG TPA: HRDC domain-containing protein [Kofleriaceae bacterium]|nr:HRDC domain-containing protein [Kofleriaceae bacterium]
MNPADLVVTEDARVAEISARIADAGRLYFDLEFVSEARLVPELALLQVAWGAADAGCAALIDCVACDPSPVFALISAPEIQIVAHAAKQDLGLLATRYQVRATQLWDTQIAAAFVGLGDQIGYGKLVKEIAGLELDKGQQFTAWLTRPLTPDQLEYALNDVRYLPQIWDTLRGRLEERGRLEWVREESLLLAEGSVGTLADQEVYTSIKGWRGLDPRAAGSLRALAAWRQQTARDKNKPLSWVLPDKAMLDLCRARARSESDLRRVRGIGDGTVRRYGAEILERIQEGARRPIPRDPHGGPAALSPHGVVWAAVVSAMVQSRCAEAEVAPRFAGTRADVEALVAWFEAGTADESEISLLQGWRREMVGADALAWLRGDRVISAQPGAPAPIGIAARTPART